MSYQDLLSQYTQRMNDVKAHADDMEANNLQAKANSMEDAFKKITDPLTSASEGISSLGGAFHAGRKVYNRIKAKRLAKAKAQKGEGEDTEGSQATGGDGADAAAKPEGQGTEAPTSEGAGQPVPSEPEPVAADAPTGSAISTEEAADAVVAKDNAQDAGEAANVESDPALEAAQNPELGTAMRTGRSLNIATKGARQAPFQRPDDAPQQQRPPTEPEEGPQPQSAADKLGEPQAGEPSYSTSGAGSQAQDVSQRADTLEGDIGNQGGAAPKTISSEAGGAAEEGAEAGSSLGNTISEGAGNIGKTVGKTLLQTGEKALPEALEGASTALDFLGPVGLGVGAVTGLVDLFENLFGKPNTDKIQPAPEGGTAGGIDLGAMASKQVANVAV